MKRPLIGRAYAVRAAILAAACAMPALAAAPASAALPLWAPSLLDDANRAAGAAGPNWTNHTAVPLWINANQRFQSGSGATGAVGAYWNADQSDADVEASLTVQTLGPSWFGLRIRMREVGAANTVDGYQVLRSGNAAYIYRLTNNAQTQIAASGAIAWASGDQLGVKMVGNQITAYRKPVAGSWTAIATATDSTYPDGGYIGVNWNGNHQIDDIRAENVDAPPATPSALTATPGDGHNHLSWAASAGANGYRLYRDGATTPIYDGSATSYDDVGLTNGVSYDYQVSAYDAAGESAKSAVVSATPEEPVGYGGFNSAEGILPPASWRPFSSTSPWNTPLGVADVTHPNSDTYVESILELADHQENADVWDVGRLHAGWGDDHDYGHPIYFATSADPQVTLDRTTSGTDAADGDVIHVPAGAAPAGAASTDPGLDGHIAIVQPDGTEYDLWRASSPSGGTMAYAIGRVADIEGPGYGAGATASGFPLTAGIVRGPELAAGEIDHALFVVLKAGANPTDLSFGYGTVEGEVGVDGSSVFPANSGDARAEQLRNGGAGLTLPPMGARLRVNLTPTQIDALTVPNWHKAMLKALAEYGGYFGDTGGSGFNPYQLESYQSYVSMGLPNPFTAYGAAHPGEVSGSGTVVAPYIFDPNAGVDWEEVLEVVVPPDDPASP